MAVVFFISFAMFADFNEVRNRFGQRFVAGYHHWEVGVGTEDYADIWATKRPSGRWGLELFEFALVLGMIGLPAVTWKAATSAIYKKEAECVYTDDGKRTETSKT